MITNNNGFNSQSPVEDNEITKEELLKIQKEFKDIEREIGNKKETLGQLDNEIQAKRNSINDLDEEIAGRKTERSKLKRDVDEAKTELNELREEAADIEDEIDQKFDSNNEIISKRNADCDDWCKRMKKDADEYVKRIESEAKLKLSAAEKRLETITQAETVLAERERLVYEKENDAKNDFYLQKSEAFRKLNDEIDKKRFELDELKNNIEIELSAHRNKLLDKIATEIRIKREQFEREKESFDAMVQDYKEEQIEYEEKRISLEQREAEVSMKENALENVVSQKVHVAYAVLEKKLQDTETICSSYEDELSKANKEIMELRRQNKMNNKEDITVLKELNDQLKAENETYKKQLKHSIDMEKFEDVKLKADSFEELQVKYNELLAEKQELTNSLLVAGSYDDEVKTLRAVNESQSEENRKLREELEQIHKNSTTLEYRKQAIERPYFTAMANPQFIMPKDCTETEWLDEIHKQSGISGIKYNKRILYAYHTALKNSSWSPLTVLAGVSGTGKSELPRQYALHGGLNFLSVPVKPDWDSPQSLFGFYNSVENKFEAKDVLRILRQMSIDPEFKKQMSIILLDEMNLAHVELYFSDLLSKLESRRGNTEKTTIPFELGGDVSNLEIELTPNVLWTGTMNEDETTKSLSDKVIDRSTLITFPRPKKLYSRSVNKSNEESRFSGSKLHFGTWGTWYKGNMLNCENASCQPFGEKISAYCLVVEEINSSLSITGRALGHRVWQGIEQYMAHYPRLIEAFQKTGKIDEDIMNQAFAEAIAFKVMPKLRGLETSGKLPEKCLNAIGEIIAGSIKELQYDFDKARNHPSKLFQWHSANFLDL